MGGLRLVTHITRAYHPAVDVKGSKKAQAWVIVAVFATAMSWTSVCSFLCALDAYSQEALHFSGHISQHRDSDLDCVALSHLNVLDKTLNSPYLHSADAARLDPNELAVCFTPESLAREAFLEASAPGPPGAPASPSFQQALILRI